MELPNYFMISLGMSLSPIELGALLGVRSILKSHCHSAQHRIWKNYRHSIMFIEKINKWHYFFPYVAGEVKKSYIQRGTNFWMVCVLQLYYLCSQNHLVFFLLLPLPPHMTILWLNQCSISVPTNFILEKSLKKMTLYNESKLDPQTGFLFKWDYRV